MVSILSGPCAEVIAVPVLILLMCKRHVIFHGSILAWPSVKPAMGRNALVVIKDFYGGVC